MLAKQLLIKEHENYLNHKYNNLDFGFHHMFIACQLMGNITNDYTESILWKKTISAYYKLILMAGNSMGKSKYAYEKYKRLEMNNQILSQLEDLERLTITKIQDFDKSALAFKDKITDTDLPPRALFKFEF